MTVVDAWLVFNQYTDTTETQTYLYLSLAEELIDNVHNNPISSRRNPTSEDVTHNGIKMIDFTGRARCGVDVHLTPTRKKRKLREVTVKNIFYKEGVMYILVRLQMFDHSARMA